jgi:hypothetical protein
MKPSAHHQEALLPSTTDVKGKTECGISATLKCKTDRILEYSKPYHKLRVDFPDSLLQLSSLRKNKFIKTVPSALLQRGDNHNNNNDNNNDNSNKRR